MLPQERAIIELYRKCSTAEEFSHRVRALEELATAFSNKLTKKILGPKKSNLKSVALLKELLERHVGLGNAKEIVAPLKHLNRFRQGYPRHADSAEGVLDAYKFFNIEYPTKDWETSWRKLLEHLKTSYLYWVRELDQVEALIHGIVSRGAYCIILTGAVGLMNGFVISLCVLAQPSPLSGLNGLAVS